MNFSRYKRLLLGILGLGILVPGGLVFHHFQTDLAQARQRVAAGGKVINTPCGPIQYAEFGDGAPMLMIHGAGGGYDQGEYFARLIGGSYRWIAPSRFGYLGSPAPENASSELQADAYACVLDALGIDQVGIVGVSGGGSSALLFAQRYPERSTSLVMVDAVSHTMPARPAYLSTVFNVFTNDFVFWTLIHTDRAGLLNMLGVSAEDQKNLSAENLAQAYTFVESILPMGDRKAGQNLEQHMSEFDAEQIRQITAPVLVLHARNDSLVAYDQGEFTVQMISGARMVTMESGGHLALMFDANANALEQARRFIAQHN